MQCLTFLLITVYSNVPTVFANFLILAAKQVEYQDFSVIRKVVVSRIFEILFFFKLYRNSTTIFVKLYLKNELQIHYCYNANIKLALVPGENF